MRPVKNTGLVQNNGLNLSNPNHIILNLHTVGCFSLWAIPGIMISGLSLFLSMSVRNDRRKCEKELVPTSE